MLEMAAGDQSVTGAEYTFGPGDRFCSGNDTMFCAGTIDRPGEWCGTGRDVCMYLVRTECMFFTMSITSSGILVGVKEVEGWSVGREGGE